MPPLTRQALGKKSRSGTGYTHKERGRKIARETFIDLGSCERCGKPATDRHHKDENTWNNNKYNIEFLCRRCHSQHHFTRTEIVLCKICQRPVKPLRKMMCNACYEYVRRGKHKFRRLFNEKMPRGEKGKCFVPNCDRLTRNNCSGPCEMHYYRMRRTGSYKRAEVENLK